MGFVNSVCISSEYNIVNWSVFIYYWFLKCFHIPCPPSDPKFKSQSAAFGNSLRIANRKRRDRTSIFSI